MSHYYFGLNLYAWIVLALSFLGTGIYFVYLYSKNKTKLKRNCFLISFGFTFMFAVLAFDLNSSYIEESKSIELERALTASKIYPEGEKFRKAMGDLAKEKGILVDSDTSYLGKDIYLTYITKSDWNNIAKVYNGLGMPNIIQ